MSNLQDSRRVSHPSLRPLLQRKLLFFTGKGGVGKSLSAASFALLASQHNHRVLIVQSGACDQISPLFGKKQKPASLNAYELAPKVSLMNLDMPSNLRAFIQTHVGSETLYRTFMDNQVMRTFFESVPGLEQISYLGHITHMAEQTQDYDLVVVDGYSSGHFLSLIGTPKSVADTHLGGKLLGLVTQIHNYLADPAKTLSVVVSLPEPLVISETNDLISKLQTGGSVQCGAIFLNRSIGEEESTKAIAPNAWIQAHFRKRQSEQKEAEEALNSSPIKVPYYRLTDCGYVSEPLSASFPQLLFNNQFGGMT